MRRSSIRRRWLAAAAFLSLVGLALRPALSDEISVQRPEGYPTSTPISVPWMPDSVETSGAAHKWGLKKDKRYLKIHASAADINRSHGMVATRDHGAVVQVAGGAESVDRVTVSVTRPPGGTVLVAATNTIRSLVKVHALNGDTHIVDGKGIATDINGGVHEYPIDVNLTKASETQNVSETSVELNVGANAQAQSSSSPGGSTVGGTVAASIGAAFKFGTTSTYKHGTTISYQPPMQTTPDVVISDSDGGDVPFETSWTWASEFHVRIGTKATQGGGEAETVLETFQLKNDVSVWYMVTPPDAQTTPSLGEVLLDLPEPRDRNRLPDDGPSVVGEIGDAVGLANEDGAGEGMLLVWMDGTRAVPTTFDVTTSPAAVTDLPDRITIAAGDTSVLEPYQALQSGEFTVVLTALDAEGEPTDTVVEVDARATSLADVDAPDVHLGLDSPVVNASADGGVALVVPDTSDVTLVARRTGFAGYASTETDVALTVDDPQEILSGVPSLLTIAPGASSAATTFDVTTNTGEASITGTDGVQTWTLRIRTGAQALRTPRTSIILPVRSTAYFPVHFLLFQDAPRTVEVASSAPTVVAVPESRSSLAFDPAVRMRLAGMEALAEGTATLTFSSPGLANATLAVTVVPQDVVPTRTGVTCQSLGGANGGTIHLRLPQPAVFADVEAPSGSEGWLDVSGGGTGVLTLRFAAGEPRPESARVGYEVLGAPAGDVAVEVWDLLHEHGVSYETAVEEE